MTGHQQPDAAPLPSIYGGVLIGGGSTRMGTPKHLLRAGQRTFLEHVLAALEPCVSQLVLLGSGEVPERCQHLTRLPDPPDIAGPLAGMLAAMRWNPDVAWLFAACDLPLITPAAIAWLLEQRSPERVAVLPRLWEGEAPAEPDVAAGPRTGRPGPARATPQADTGTANVEPLLAVYEPQARQILEELAESGHHAPHRVAAHEFVFTPAPPADLARAWQNVNTPDDLESLS
jgi:molybdopterin-guanine dinucleotide biosynthesis protein A